MLFTKQACFAFGFQVLDDRSCRLGSGQSVWRILYPTTPHILLLLCTVHSTIQDCGEDSPHEPSANSPIAKLPFAPQGLSYRVNTRDVVQYPGYNVTGLVGIFGLSTNLVPLE